MAEVCNRLLRMTGERDDLGSSLRLSLPLRLGSGSRAPAQGKLDETMKEAYGFNHLLILRRQEDGEG